MGTRAKGWLLIAAVAAAMTSYLVVSVNRPAGATVVNPPTQYYLALGGSGSVGLQPTVAYPQGQLTDTGYANDLLATERSRWNGLQLVQLGCPGETTNAFLSVGDHCRLGGQTQLAEAVAFLRAHPNTVLMTVDLGFNDVLSCMEFRSVYGACVNQSLATIRQQLPQILAALKAAGSPSLRVVGVGHYDPYLGAYRHGKIAKAFALASVDTMNRLNNTLEAIYSAAGIPMADVAGAFQINRTDPTFLPGVVGTVPRNVQRTCQLTWMCALAPLGPNQHPNDAGYRVIAQAIANVIPA